jgi:hypothetical protein
MKYIFLFGRPNGSELTITFIVLIVGLVLTLQSVFKMGKQQPSFGTIFRLIIGIVLLSFSVIVLVAGSIR